MKLLGVDYGTRRIGIACTDATGVAVRSIGIVDRTRVADPIAAIHALVLQHSPNALVLGLPLDYNDRETAMSLEVREFAAGLAGKTGLPVHFVDESYSSHRAAELLRFRKKKTRRDKQNADKLAACLILESYLREQPSQLPPP
jgi:putative Holliday junction resolvase